MSNQQSALVVKKIGQAENRHWLTLRPNADAKPPVVAVDHMSLQVEEGDVFGLLGANGSGKSILIRLISTLLIPDQGTITMFGHDVRHTEKVVNRLITRVSVEAACFKKISALNNLLYVTRLYNLAMQHVRA